MYRKICPESHLHHEACRVMPNSDPAGQFFLYTPINHGRFFFLHTLQFFCLFFFFVVVFGHFNMRDINRHFNRKIISFLWLQLYTAVHIIHYTLCNAEDKSCHFVNICWKKICFNCSRKFSLKLMFFMKQYHA